MGGNGKWGLRLVGAAPERLRRQRDRGVGSKGERSGWKKSRIERAGKGGRRMRMNGDWMKAAPLSLSLSPLVLYAECTISLIF